MSELAVEGFEAGEVQLAAKELLAHGAEKPLHFSLGRAVAHRRVGEQAADPGADLDDFLGGVDGAVIHVQASWNPAFVEGGAEGFDEGIDVFGREELAVATDAAGVIDESDEAGLDGRALELDVRAVEGVGLPHFIGVGFGKSQALFVFRLGLGLEHVELFDDAARRCWEPPASG